MFYISKTFGEGRELREAPVMGLRLERNLDRGVSRFRYDAGARPATALSFADLRWTVGFGESVRLLGVPVHRSQSLQDALNAVAFDSGEMGSSESSAVLSSGESGNNLRTWLIGISISAAVLCVLGEVICEDSGSSSPGLD